MGVIVVRLSFKGGSSASMEGRKAAMANRSLFLVVVLVIESRKIEEDEDEQERPKE